PAKRILVPYLGSPHDRLALELANQLARATAAAITVIHVVPPKRDQVDDARTLGAKSIVDRAFQEPGQSSPVEFRVIEHESPVTAILAEAQNADLVLIGIGEEWGLESHIFSWRRERIAQDCPTSLLIVRKYQN